jgi:hypothetical protein
LTLTLNPLLLGSIDEFPEFINDASNGPSASSSSSSSQLPKTTSVYANAQAQDNAHHPILSSSQAQNPYGTYEYDLPSLNLGTETPCPSTLLLLRQAAYARAEAGRRV